MRIEQLGDGYEVLSGQWVARDDDGHIIAGPSETVEEIKSELEF